LGGVSTAGALLETVKSGYVGQLYEITGLALTAGSPNVNEGTTDLLAAWQALDDASFLAVPAARVAWSVASGPLTRISAAGLATAGIVYQDTAAAVQGIYLGQTGALGLTVKNVNLDDFAEYAGDGLDDAWQVQHFGAPPNANAGANADADGTGQTNLFKYVAGLNPLDGSRFALTIAPVLGQPAQKNLIFSPVVAGRTYTISATSNLAAPTWSPIVASAPNDNGATRTITDLSSTGTPKFYRVEITKP